MKIQTCNAYPGSPLPDKWYPQHELGGIKIEDADKSQFDDLAKAIDAAKAEGKLGVPFSDALVTGRSKDADRSKVDWVQVTIIPNTTTDDPNLKKYWITDLTTGGDQANLYITTPYTGGYYGPLKQMGAEAITEENCALKKTTYYDPSMDSAQKDQLDTHLSRYAAMSMPISSKK